MPFWFYILDSAILFLVLLVIGKSPSMPRSVKGLILLLFNAANFYALLWADCNPTTAGIAVGVLLMTSLALPATSTSFLDESLGKHRFWIFLGSTVTIFLLLYIYLPITIFLTSPDEIKIHLNYLVTTNLKNAMVFVYLAVLLYLFVFFDRLKTTLTFIGVFLLLELFLYSYAFPFGYPIMNGLLFEQLPISGKTLAFRIILDVAVFLAVAAFSYVVLLRWKKILLQSIVILNVSLLIFAYYKVSGTQFRSATKHAANAPMSERVVLTNTGKNVLYLFEDRLMSGYIEKILQEDARLASRFEGFVWYPKTVSPGLNSISGLPGALGGYDYTPLTMNEMGKPLVEIENQSYLILPYNFSKAGYLVRMINPRGLGFTVEGDCSVVDLEGVTCLHHPSSFYIEMAKRHEMPTETLIQSNYSDLMVLLGSMRAAPYAIKHVLNKRGPWKPFLDHSSGTTFKQWCELKALPEITGISSDSTPRMNMFFNMLPHEPYFIDEDEQPTKSFTQFEQGHYRSQGFQTQFGYQHYLAAKATMHLLADYFDWMREKGVYDNTKIIIFSDHGIRGQAIDPSTRAKEGGTTGYDFVAYRSALFVKDVGAKGDMRVSEEFKPNATAPQFACEEIGGCVNPYLNDKPIATDGRDDPFYCVETPWQFNLQKEKELVIMRILELRNKKPYHRENWREVRLQN